MSAVETITSYPLASLQGAMLVNHLRAPRSGVDVLQVVSTLEEPLDVDTLEAAWAQATGHHDVLRTAFRWEDVPEPRQDLHSRAPVPFTLHDWSALEPQVMEARWRTLLSDDRTRGFDLRELPLQRVTVVRLGPTSWRVLWTLHHILMDGRSFSIVLREIFAAYDAARHGETPAAFSSPPYADFAAWYSQCDFASAESAWREYLHGLAGPTPLPAAFPRSGGTGRGWHERFVNAAATASLGALARRHDVTMNTVVQAAWAILLARHAGEDQVVFGATRAGRRGTVPGAETMVGLFINTLPVRARVAADRLLSAVLAELRSDWRSMSAVEHTPMQLVQRWTDAGSSWPLFETHVVYEHQPLDRTMRAAGAEHAGRSFRWYGATNFPVTVLVYGGEQLALEIDYDRARIDDETARRLLDHLAAILASMAANPETVDDVSMLPDAERELVVRTWNDTATPYPDTTLVALLADQAARAPTATAVRDEHRALTYAELDRAATSLARRLRSHGVARNVRVGICGDRSVELVVGLVAILKAGGAYVPLDPEYPSDRLAFMLEDAGVSVLLAHRAAAVKLPAHAATVVWLDDVLERTTGDGPRDTLPLPDSRDPAYMIYTSGSTGRPKGAVNAHHGIVNRLLWMQNEYRLEPGDVVLQKTPFSFDVSVWEFFWPLLSGATLVMARPGGHRDTAYLVDVITKQRVSVCHFVPSMLRAFLADGGASTCTTLRDVMASGEALPPDLVAAFYRALPNARLHNLYGPTECAVDVTYWPCPPSTEPPPVVPIGRPVANTQMYVLDARGEPTAIGVAGELFIAGDQVGLGYHNRPELTAERFVRDPFSSKPGARMYRTGDKARWRPDGTIEYLGRLDFQVKIRGFRIELGEIEAALAQHPAVREAVVVARTDDGGDPRLVAYLIADGRGAPPPVSELRDHLRETLPDYMVPAAFMWFAAMPLSSNGKVDRRALPAPELERETLSREYVAPRTPTERTLADIWAQVLRLDRVGAEDNFFELGGDSLLSVQIVSRASLAGLRVTLMQVMRHPTVAGLAAVAEPMRAAGAVDQSEVVGPVPLTPIQRWFFERQPDGASYWNQALLFTVPADLRADVLDDAFAAVVRQHDSLRLRFEHGAGGWQQRCVADDARPIIEEIDVSALAGDDQRVAIEAACVRIQSSLDISAGPTIGAALFRTGDASGRLLIAVHHLAIDGVSWRVLREDLETAYAQRMRGEPVVLPAQTTPFGRWATHLASPPVRDGLRDEVAYWTRVGSPALPLPRDTSAAGPDVASNTDTVIVRLDEVETRALLQSVPKAYNTQINDALVSSLADALSTWLGDGEIVVNIEGHGREDLVEHADLSRTLGWFTTLFPIRLRLGASDTPSRLKDVKEMLRAVPRRGAGYGVLRYLGDAGVPSTTPEIVFNYLGQFDQVTAGSSLFGFASESTGPWTGPATRRPHLLEVNGLVIDGRLELRWSYSTGAHRRETIARVADAYIASLRATIEHCTSPGAGGYTPSDFPLARLDQPTLDRVIGGRRDIEDVYPVVPLQQLFLGFADAADDPGFEQWRYRLRGPLDLGALRGAWELVVSRHAILRTAFVHDGLAEPLQVVSRSAALSWTQHDIRALSPDEQTRRVNEMLAADRAAGFAYDRPPLMRIIVIRLADDRYELVWSNHHLLIDRWTWPLILLDISRAYPALAANQSPSLDPAPRYRDFVAWQRAQSLDRAREFWTRHFANFAPPSRLAILHPDAADEPDEVSASLSPDETRALESLARSCQVAPNTVVEGAWALWLARRSRHADISFGLSVAGRDGAVPGIERLVGLTLNNLPVRVHVDESERLATWLRTLQESQAEVQQYAYTPLDKIQEWSGLPWRTRLFETLIVFQHDDAGVRTHAWLGKGIATDAIHVPTRTAYPLSVIVTGVDAIALRLTYDPRYFDAATAREMLIGFRSALAAMAASPAASVGDVLGLLPEPHVEAMGAARDGEYIAPRTATESVLAGVWSEVLGVERVGVTDDFFGLGGYSLVATQIASRVRATLQLDMPVRLLFQHPTVAKLAEALKARERKPGQLERIAQVVQRVNAMSLDELRDARAARAGIT